MIEPALDVCFYSSASGREPVRDFLRALPAEDRKRVGVDIKTVQFGWPLGMPLVRKIAPGLWEVRSDIAGGIVRMLFTTQGARMVLLHAFVKKSRKTPTSDLKIALGRLHQLQRGSR
ncbi:type II toxin-antitoxin system RelE/ParE family toxin [Alloalcanivorax mobilis]|uniref:type II toxin-antitoxin system RelE/ParE family toxin n=1 Tax=Alloalcanivorax mobilis TaxID=2019569 RepID=UPI000C77299F|nr:type II toxin-antitoxin system RelE/ParE family toxin [Alloalcanivorax mobilis]